MCSQLPADGQMVYADNGKFSSDRAVFKNGKFVGESGYTMSCVRKWFPFSEYDDYHRHCKGLTCYSVGFDIAETIKNPPKRVSV